MTPAYEKIEMPVQPEDTYCPTSQPFFAYHISAQMSLSLPFPATFHAVSQPLVDDEVMRQVEEHLEDERRIDEADYSRLVEYEYDIAPVPDPAVAALSTSVRLLTVPEDEEEEVDNHSCADSGCQGEHTHADYDEYEDGHRSPRPVTPSYPPDPFYEGIDYSYIPDSD